MYSNATEEEGLGRMKCGFISPCYCPKLERIDLDFYCSYSVSWYSEYQDNQKTIDFFFGAYVC